MATSDRKAADLAGDGLQDRLSRWFFGAPNLVGLGLSIPVVGLFIAGVISGPLVPLLALGAYGVGMIGTPRPKGLAAGSYSGGLDARALGKELARLEGESRRRLPKALADKVESIAATITELLPLLNNSSVDRQDLFALERTVSDYLPTALDNYLRLPHRYATSHVVADGKTPTDILGEQLDLIDEKMHEISEALAKDDVSKLLAQGRFLEERFGSPSSELDVGSRPASSSAPH